MSEVETKSKTVTTQVGFIVKEYYLGERTDSKGNIISDSVPCIEVHFYDYADEVCLTLGFRDPREISMKKAHEIATELNKRFKTASALTFESYSEPDKMFSYK